MAGSDNINANRILAGATVPVLDLSRVVINNQQTGQPPTFQKAVVEEVIYNPKDLSIDDRNRLRSVVINPELVDLMAANSVVATLVSDGISDATPAKAILGPFFQSHMMLPVQAGEQVTVIFDDFQKFGFRSGKWMTRSSEGFTIEDPNFTHGDRRYEVNQFTTQRLSSSINNQNASYTPGFPNGGGDSNTHSLPQNGATNPFDTIYQATREANLEHQYEVVPRWTKRPQEFVLQGMNNSLIMLGQDRVGYVTGSAATEQKNYAGAIDIVTGRGRYHLSPDDNSIPNNQKEHKKTSPFVVTNSRSLNETDKVPRLNNRTEQLQEGDPDFVHDAARIYVSMKTLGDTNFRLAKATEGNVNDALQPTGINYSPKALYPVQFASSSNDVGASYIIEKADHIRLVARRSVPTEDNLDPVISGSILLIKEGKNRTAEDSTVGAATEDHLAYLYMSPEGRVQIDGMQIFLGGAALREENQSPQPDVPLNSDDSNGEPNVGSENQFVGIEPYIKWSEFKKTVEGLQKQIFDLQQAFSALVDGINDGAAGSVCPPGGKDPGWLAFQARAVSANSTLGSNIPQHRTETNEAVYRSRSAKIFGQ